MMIEAMTFDLGGSPSVSLSLVSSDGLAPLSLPIEGSVEKFRQFMEGDARQQPDVSCGLAALSQKLAASRETADAPHVPPVTSQDASLASAVSRLAPDQLQISEPETAVVSHAAEASAADAPGGVVDSWEKRRPAASEAGESIRVAEAADATRTELPFGDTALLRGICAPHPGVNSAVDAPVRDAQQTVERAIIEKPIIEKPIIERAIIEQPVAEMPAVDVPVIAKPVIARPIVEKPDAEPLDSPDVVPVIAKPVVARPIVEKPDAAPLDSPDVVPVIAKPVVARPIVEKPDAAPLDSPDVRVPQSHLASHGAETPTAVTTAPEPRVATSPVAEAPASVETSPSHAPLGQRAHNVAEAAVETPVHETPILETTAPEPRAVSIPASEAPAAANVPRVAEARPIPKEYVEMRSAATTIELRGNPPAKVQILSSDGLAPLPVPRAAVRFASAMEDDARGTETPLVHNPLVAPSPLDAGMAAPPSELAASAASARTEVIVETVNEIVETVVDRISVTPSLGRGGGDIRITLRPTVLDGSTIKLSASGGNLTVAVAPATPEAASTAAAALPRLEAALAAHAPAFLHVAVVLSAVKKGKANETA